MQRVTTLQTFVFNKLAKVVVLPKSLKHWCIRGRVVLPNQCTKVARGLRPVICVRRYQLPTCDTQANHAILLTEGHLREKVVNHVIVRNIMQEEATLPAEEVAIDGARSATLEGPFTFSEMGQLRVGVVEVGDHDKLRRVRSAGMQIRQTLTYRPHPMTDGQPWYTVVFYNSGGSVYRAAICDEPSHQKNANVRKDDRIALARVEEYGRCYNKGQLVR